MCKLISLLFLTVMFVSCKTTQIKTVKDAEKSYNEGLKMLDRGRYIQAREIFEEIRTKMPDTRFAVMSELKIADSYFEEGSFLEAISSYEVFESLYPGHREREYVIYRIGLAQIEMTPRAIDRDLESAKEAIRTFNRLINMYPESEYKDKAFTKIEEARKKLLNREYYVGNYYFKRGLYKSSLRRYEDIILNYSDIKDKTVEKSLHELWIAYSKLDDQKNADRVKEILKQKYPGSKF